MLMPLKHSGSSTYQLLAESVYHLTFCNWILPPSPHSGNTNNGGNVWSAYYWSNYLPVHLFLMVTSKGKKCGELPLNQVYNGGQCWRHTSCMCFSHINFPSS